jgi:hypothetical protein
MHALNQLLVLFPVELTWNCLEVAYIMLVGLSGPKLDR